jgi:hypothetical protein
MYSNKYINFPYLKVISSLSSAYIAVRQFVSFLQISGPTRSTNKEELSMLSL